MAMGERRRRAKQASMWVATQDLPRSAAHPFYTRLTQILDKHDFDSYVEGLCQRFYAHEDADDGDTETSIETLMEAAEQLGEHTANVLR